MNRNVLVVKHTQISHREVFMGTREKVLRLVLVTICFVGAALLHGFASGLCFGSAATHLSSLIGDYISSRHKP